MSLGLHNLQGTKQVNVDGYRVHIAILAPITGDPEQGLSKLPISGTNQRLDLCQPILERNICQARSLLSLQSGNSELFQRYPIRLLGSMVLYWHRIPGVHEPASVRGCTRPNGPA